jgi:hypothetical protein
MCNKPVARGIRKQIPLSLEETKETLETMLLLRFVMASPNALLGYSRGLSIRKWAIWLRRSGSTKARFIFHRKVRIHPSSRDQIPRLSPNAKSQHLDFTVGALDYSTVNTTKAPKHIAGIRSRAFPAAGEMFIKVMQNDLGGVAKAKRAPIEL